MRNLDRGKEMAGRRRRSGELRAPRRPPPSRTRRFLRWVMPANPIDTLASATVAAGLIAVVANALWLQESPHPAPLFGEAAKTETRKSTLPAAPAPVASIPPAAAPLPLQRPDTAGIRGRNELVLSIQRGLAERGYYDGAVDGLIGPRTVEAIRIFEQTNGIRITGEPSEALLARILQSRARSEITGSLPPAEVPMEVPMKERVLAVQKVLARLGYGPVRINGRLDDATRAAIAQFERDRALKPSGEVSGLLIRELVAVTGTSVE